MSSAIATAFDAALAQGTRLTHEDLVRAFPPGADSSVPVPPLEKIKHFKRFAISPDEANRKLEKRRKRAAQKLGEAVLQKILRSNRHHELRKERRFDFRLSVEETERLQRNGFVVSERLAADSFAEQYYRLYSDDMPVYVTSDSVLHAWHRSFDAFLVALEEELLPLLASILEEARDACASILAADGHSLSAVLGDVDMYLAVAESLLMGEPASTIPDAAILETTLDGIRKQQLGSAQLFSCPPREVDFSLFKPRGHYTKSELLTRYFRAMTWLGTIDFRVDGTYDPVSDRRQLQIACVLVHVLRKANVLPLVDTVHTVISSIAGDGIGADSMTPQQLHELLGDRNILGTYGGANSETALRELQDEIANLRLGAQAIAGHPLMESNAAAASPSTRTRLPTSFAFFGQQFVWSAFVFSKVVYDQVLQDDTKVVRRIPSAVDAAFALFANDISSGEIAKRMTSTAKTSEDFVKFRDGAPYASNLLAVRRVIDEQLAKANPTTCSLALLLQLALRELSAKSSNEDGVFHSETWKKRQMNTQIASFTQLRHDTILYAKQDFSMRTKCEYAAGFVDPYPAFWIKMQQLAERTLRIVTNISEILPKKEFGPFGDEKLVDKTPIVFANFAQVTGKLKDIAIAQSLKQKLSEEQDTFLKSVIEQRFGSGASRYLGWYPSLFYTKREDSGVKDHLVADVHTDTPSEEYGDPGGILHLGVGDVNLGFFAVDEVMYAGPVFSSYEFVTKIDERLDDDDFSDRVAELKAPLWARESFLVAK